MIAKIKSIPHGHANLAYIMGESKKKEHAREKIQFVASHGLDPFHRSAEAWEEIKRACRDHREIKNTMVRVILSPTKEESKNFTIDDWEKLWNDFIDVYDTYDHRNEETGELISKPTNFRNSIYTVYVHYDSESGVPHLHGAVCRVDNDGKTNPDGNTHLRAHKVADIVNQQRGWKSPKKIRDRQIKNLNALCKDILLRMPQYSLMEFHSRLQAAGYEVLTKADTKGVIHGHSIKKDNCHYKMSEIGREFTVSRLPETWHNLHKTNSASLQSQSITPTSSTLTHKHIPVVSKSMSSPDYTVPKSGYRPYEIKHNRRDLKYYLPGNVVDLFDNEFDSREISNTDEMIRTAVSLFVGVLLPADVPNVGTGGGGTSSHLPWGRDPKEDEIEWAKHCAQMARQISKPQPRMKFHR